MKTIYSTLVLYGCLFVTGETVQAHALWIETHSTGTPGKPHEVRIYYGEPAESVRERVSDWWSDVGAFTLFLYGPEGRAQVLPVTAGDDHYAALFIPDREGTYVLCIAQPVSETFDRHKYQFNSLVPVQIGHPQGKLHSLSDAFWVVARSTGRAISGTPVQVTVQLDGKPVEKLEIKVFSPNGWSKTFVTDTAGSVTFVPDRPGHYLVEAIHRADVTGDTFDHLHRIATSSLTVE